MASSIPVRIGTMLFLSLTVPPYKRPIRMTGEVVRVIGGGPKNPQGMGIRFVGLPESAYEKLDKFLSKTEKKG